MPDIFRKIVILINFEPTVGQIPREQDMESSAHENTDEAGQILISEHRNGALVVGGEAAVAAFLARWKADGEASARTVEVTGNDRVAAISRATDLGAAGATTAKFLWSHKASEVGNTASPAGTTATLRLLVQDRKTGQVVSNKEVNPAKLLGLAQPEVALGLIALRLALAESTAQIVEAVERVEGKTDELLRLAGADRTGDVVGHHRLLRRRVDQLEDGCRLGDTDWSTVASLGPELEAGVERLRSYASRLAQDLPPGLKADERARRLERVVRDGRLGEVLRLLVVSEQSLYLWQRLRIEQINNTEPLALDDSVAEAHDVLADYMLADADLIEALRTALDDYGVLRPSEFHRTFSGRKLRSALGALRADMDYFVAARGLQIEGWSPLVAPTAREALRHARAVAIDSGRSLKNAGGAVVDVGLAGVSRAGGAVQARADKWRASQPDDGPVETALDVDDAAGSPK